MGTRKGKIPPDKHRKDAGSFSNAPCKNTGPKTAKDLEKRITIARAALHDAIRRVGERPLSQCPEVLRLSRVLDGLINEMQNKKT